MRILFLTNFYPPYERGGYEQNCLDVAETLKRRGHSVFILTSDYMATNKEEKGIYRVLNTEVDWHPHMATIGFFFNRKSHLNKNIARFLDLVNNINPDILFVWGMWNLQREILIIAESLTDLQVVYYISDYWPMLPDAYTLHWRETAIHPGLVKIKKLLARFAQLQISQGNCVNRVRFEHAICVSQSVKQQLTEAGLPLFGAKVVHNAVDIDELFNHSRFSGKANRNDRLALLYAGRLSPEKGLHTAIEAVSKVIADGSQITLTIVGQGVPNYMRFLANQVFDLKLQENIRFHDWVPRNQMGKLFSQHDVFLYPSVWPEPLSLSIQQAMAMGLVVISTSTGGTPEILTENENGLLFPAEDSGLLAKQIKRLTDEPGLYTKLAQSAKAKALNEFSIHRMVDELEEYLQFVLETG